MKFALVCLAAVLACAAASDVVILTESNFDDILAKNENVLVEFFAPWCGHCKKLAPEYETAATALKADGIVLGSVDATIEKDLAGKFEVRGYPTLKLFRNGEPSEYKGGRTSDTIISWMRKATGPPCKKLDDTAAVKAFADGAKVAIVGYFTEEGAEFKTLEEVAKADDDLGYGYTLDSAAAEEAGVTPPAVVLYKKFDEGKNTFDGEITKSAVQEFVQANSNPLVIPFSMDVVGSIFQSKVGKVAFLFTESEMDFYAGLAEEYRGKLVFATADSSEPRLNDHIGIKKDDFPKLYILETSDQMKKYPLEEAPTKDSVKAHIEAYLAGELKPSYKSDPIPEPNDGPVTVVVGKNFDDIVMDEEKDVLLEVYAPWCGHCKKIEPIYNDLGDKFKSNPNVVIAKMDGTTNEVESISVRGFPTLKFFPAGKKTPGGEEYSGGRELDDFVKFLEENGKAKAPAAKDEL